MKSPLLRLLRLHDAAPAERRATLWTAVAFFCVLFAYYLLRPLRENVGYAFGESRMLGLYVLTFVLTMALYVPYLALVQRLPSHRFLPYALHGFAASFVLLAVAFVGGAKNLGALDWSSWRGCGLAFFYSWVSAFTVCGVTLIWVHAVEWFTTAQGKRLFGLVAVGGTLGQMLGSRASKLFADWSYPSMLGLGALGVEIAVGAWFLSLRACRAMAAARGGAPAPPPGGPSLLQGLLRVAKNPYLRGIALFVLVSSITATTFYYQRIALVGAQLPGETARRSLEADINFWQGVTALCLQLFLTSRALLALGVGVVLCMMPAASFVGLTLYGLWPVVLLYAVVEVLRRMLQFAFDKPGREVVYTVLDRQDKYAAKAVIDTAVLRLGDVVGALFNHALVSLRVGGLGVVGVAAPLLAAWAGVGLWLGRRCRQHERERGPGA
ncbi:MAG: hypothetical protein FJ265_02760 [Planctomycetes bacterium]|nr:hypothetical protein [Planctomycetota bacterium]